MNGSALDRLAARLAGTSVLVAFIVPTTLLSLTLLVGTADLGTLDAQLAYSPASVHRTLDAMGAVGRDRYRTYALVDIGFLVSYSLLFMGVLARVRNDRPAIPIVALVPGALDLVETTAILGLLASFPDLGALTLVAAIATPLKWASVVGYLVVVGVSWKSA